SYLSCGRDVLRFRAASTGQPAAPLILADPDFDLCGEGITSAPQPALTPGRPTRELDRSGYQFDRLPGARVEGERIAGLLEVSPWLGSAALEGRLKTACRSPRILHLATHGFFLEDQRRAPHERLGGLDLMSPAPGALARLTGPLPENPLLRAG